MNEKGDRAKKTQAVTMQRSLRIAENDVYVHYI